MSRALFLDGDTKSALSKDLRLYVVARGGPGVKSNNACLRIAIGHSEVASDEERRAFIGITAMHGPGTNGVRPIPSAEGERRKN